MPIATGTRLLKPLLGLLGADVVPVSGINVVGDDLVVHRLHRVQELAAGVEIRRPHVGGLDADHVDEGVFDTGHFGADLVGVHGAHSVVGPGGRLLD